MYQNTCKNIKNFDFFNQCYGQMDKHYLNLKYDYHKNNPFHERKRRNKKNIFKIKPCSEYEHKGI